MKLRVKIADETFEVEVKDLTARPIIAEVTVKPLRFTLKSPLLLWMR